MAISQLRRNITRFAAWLSLHTSCGMQTHGGGNTASRPLSTQPLCGMPVLNLCYRGRTMCETGVQTKLVFRGERSLMELLRRDLDKSPSIL